MDLDTVIRWEKNPKRHDIGALVQSITQYGFKDPPKFEPTLNGGSGGLVEGNGRDEALQWMRKQDPDHPPRGIINDNGKWFMPILFGVDAESLAMAEAYAIDHNNLVMSGGNFTLYDISKLWDENAYNKLLQELAQGGTFTSSMDKDDVDALDAILGGLLISLPTGMTTEGGEAKKTKITLVLEMEENNRLEEIVKAVREFIEKNGWKVALDV